MADDGPIGHAVAIRLDGTQIAGTLNVVDANRVQLVRPDGPTELPTRELLSLEIAVSRPTVPPTAILEFANGDRIAVEPGAAGEERLAVRFEDSAFDVPLETLRGITFQALNPDDGSAALLFRDDAAEDLVLLTNGDRLAGQMLGLSTTELTLDAEGRQIRVPRDRIAAIAFSPELIAAARIDEPRQIVHSGAGWLTVRHLTRLSDGTWRAQTAFGESVSWPADTVRRIQFVGGAVEFLSDLEPANVEFVPFLDRHWPLRIDRSVTGEPLTVGDRDYAKGLGVHSHSRVTYHLDRRFTTLRAVAGLAKSAGEIGNVEFAVELDGREVFRTSPVTRADGAIDLELDLTGVEILTLTVDFGRNGDVRDRANWCDALLIRSP